MVRYSSTCRAFGPDGSADKLRSKIHLKPPMKIKKLELAASLAYSYYTCTNLFPGFSLLHFPALSDRVSDRVLRSRVSHSPLKKPLCGLCPASVCGMVTGDALVIYWQFFPRVPRNVPRSLCERLVGPVSFRKKRDPGNN